MAQICIGLELSGKQELDRECVDSVLSQTGVELELYLLSGVGRKDFTPDPDPRIHHLIPGGAANRIHLLERIAVQSTATFVLYLDSQQCLLPDSLSALLEHAQSDETIEMVYCLEFRADECGRISRVAYHQNWEQAKQLEAFKGNSLSDYLCLDFLPGNVRLFRRRALYSKLLDPNLPGHPVDASTCAFIWRTHTLLDASLYSAPASICKHTLPAAPSTTAATVQLPRDYFTRVKALLRFRTLLPGNWSVLYIARRSLSIYCLNSPVIDAFERIHVRLSRWSNRCGLIHWRYRIAVKLFSRWRLPGPATGKLHSSTKKKIGYYIWQYPVLSQTFVQREVAALQMAGEDVIVFPEIESEHEFIGALRSQLEGFTIRNTVETESRLAKLRREMFRKMPLRYISLYLFVLGRNYHPRKDPWLDKYVFEAALRLACLARDQNINHLHSPWADTCAFIALITARFLKIPYSLQARAHDIHRHNYLFGLQEKFLNAKFIVTNTRYNVEKTQSIIGDDHADKINLIHNGLNLRQFVPTRDTDPGRTELRLLCVARLIEQKGLIYLLQTCRRLLDSGLRLRCDIVGAYEDISMNYYIALKRQQQELELEKNVCFTGSLAFEEVLGFYQEADIFVLPCVLAEDGSRDIIPNSVLEAMAMRLPVVSTTVTGLPEMVDDGRSGFLVPPHDVDALVAAIQKLADSAQLRRDFGLEGRSRVEKLFDSNINVVQFQRLFGGAGQS